MKRPIATVSFRECLLSETEFPRMSLLGSSLNKAHDVYRGAGVGIGYCKKEGPGSAAHGACVLRLPIIPGPT